MLKEWVSSFEALLAAATLATAFFPMLSFSARTRVSMIVLLGTGITLTPLLIPAEAPFARWLVAIVALCLVLKLIDLHRGALQGVRVEFRPFLAFLGNLPQLVQRRTGGERQPSGRENGRNYVLSLVGMLLSFAVLRGLGCVDWSVWPFLLQHALRASAFFVMALFMFQHLAALLRAVGFYSVEPIDRPLLARTPAEFWRRYNRWMGQFLREDVFKPLGGRRHPVRATLLVFTVSGLLHEYIFLVATGRAQGYQLAFFGLQGVAVALTLRIKPTGLAALAWGSGTMVFNLLSSVLFFASIQGLGPFYPTGLPAW